MKRLLLLLALLLPAPVWAAITSVGTVGSCTATAGGTTCVVSLSAALTIENVGLVRIGMDNAGASDGDNNEVTSVVDSEGNTYEKLCEYTYADGGAGGGATTALWAGRAATEVPIAGTVTVTFANSIGARAVQVQELNVTDGNTLQVAGTCQTENLDGGTDAASMVISGLPNKEYYFIRQAAYELQAGGITLTGGYSVITAALADSGLNGTSISLVGERIIATATGHTSDPTLTSFSGTDGVSIFVALEECTPGVDCGVVPAKRRSIIVVE